MVDPHTLIGIPYEDGGRGPDVFDCYGLVLHLYRECLNIQLPDYRSPDDRRLVSAIFRSELRLWQRREPGFGAVPLLRVPGMFHCGFMLDRDRFIHTWEHSGGVCIESLSDWAPRLVGVYEYIGD